jgi:hypothetical protein
MATLNIFQKLIEVRKSVPYLQKESKSFQYAYVGSSQVLGALKLKMDELQLLLIPRVTGHKVSESTVETFEKDTNNITKRTTTYFTELDMTMTWVNAEKPEETIECPWYGQGVDTAGEKGTGKALTYAEKYFMLKFFNVPTDKDDPDSFQKKHEEKPDKPEPQRQAQKPVNQKPVEQKPVDPKTINWPGFWANLKKQGYTEAQVHEVSGVESIAAWSRDQVNELMEKLKAKYPK